MTITALVLSVIALALGAIVGWVVGSARKAAEGQRWLAEAEARMQRALGEAEARMQRALAERDLAHRERDRSEHTVAEMRVRLEDAQKAQAVAETRVSEAEARLANHKQTEETFAALAQRAFRQVSESLVSMNKTQVTGALETKKAEIDGLLQPVREMLDNYRGELLKSEQTRNAVYGGLQEQLRSLVTVQEGAQREASRLANALQSPTVQGSWGEMSLKRCIELAGMSEYCRDFETQQTFTSEDGRRLRPDMIVNLPNNRVIAIDAKAPINDYVAATSETDPLRRKALLDQHAKNVRRRIDDLARREYQSSIGDTLDFAVLFIPGEHFLAAALTADLTLLDYAADKKIFLASPTVLLPLLRAVAASWKAEKTEESAKKMHDAAIELFARFVTVMDYFTNVGDQLRKTVDTYNKVIRSVDTRLWPKGEELQRMVGSGKKLGELEQVEAVPLESSKLRLTMQNEEPGVVVKIDRAGEAQ
ncbi:MAG TPA: DNA recombination protein RmuC [Thermoanaerobaculia bacterium]